ncbi:hypothetical protein RNAN_3369 [Rheinheimera nanhaiensis E407-8]|uniref:Uncharacterized protein n=1 Tax=Rheinheimera nanhaiensis E407-8 TaxID=562729 RepID=I1E219_9GAMM|nr:hypothetical protein RNAN_3369 [Rheinheimera nanhaiensis E407-8]
MVWSTVKLSSSGITLAFLKCRNSVGYYSQVGADKLTAFAAKSA